MYPNYCLLQVTTGTEISEIALQYMMEFKDNIERY